MKDGLPVLLACLEMRLDFVEDVLEDDVDHGLRGLPTCVDLIKTLCYHVFYYFRVG